MKIAQTQNYLYWHCFRKPVPWAWFDRIQMKIAFCRIFLIIIMLTWKLVICLVYDVMKFLRSMSLIFIKWTNTAEVLIQTESIFDGKCHNCYVIFIITFLKLKPKKKIMQTGLKSFLHAWSIWSYYNMNIQH